jgi:tRNA (uracil-5-)-methyltransferase TRM9
VDEKTIARLNQMNRDFYQTVADDFDQTRGQPWPGWERLAGYLNPGGGIPFSVLDVGCGNGRFGVFLRQRFPDVALHYHGLDSNPVLLQRAQVALAGLADIRLEERDIVSHRLDARQPLDAPRPDSGEYNLVALFGVLHHIPGAERRLSLMRTLAARVAPGGLLAFACWRFYEYPRFRERIVPWPEDMQVERHDYLLDWRRGATALRYCHYADDDEHAALIQAAGLPEMATYRADGESGDANRYSLLKQGALSR